MSDIEEVVKLLSKIQFKSELDASSYFLILIFTAIAAGIGAYLAPYLKKKGERAATKADYKSILHELKSNTEAVEEIRTKFSEQNWINQQVWLKKQEAYSSIFSLLFNVRKYVSHQVNEFQEWEDLQCHPYYQIAHIPQLEEQMRKEWERDKLAYKEKMESPEYKEEAQKLKLSYEKSISKLLDLIDLYSIYLSGKVEDEIYELKKQLSTTHDDEEWDMHFERISNATSVAIQKIREISKEELRIGI